MKIKNTLDCKKEYTDNKEFYDEMLSEAIKAKRNKCINKNGKFDYLKMAEMRHKGEW